MRVVLISNSDTAGGAAIVTLRLVQALRNEGVQADMLVVNRNSSDPAVHTAAPMWRAKAVFYTERLLLWAKARCHREHLFAIDTAEWGLHLHNHPLVRQADVILLAWVNQGTLSLRGIEQISQMGKPIVWVMHDMWNATGICHVVSDAGGCDKYQSTCGLCPLLGSHSDDDLSTQTQRRKATLYAQTKIHFVAVSHWLQDICSRSSLMRNLNVRVIYNVFPIAQFRPDRLPNADLGIADGKKVVLLSARRLDVAVKGFDLLEQLTRHIDRHQPDLAKRLHLLLLGEVANSERLNNLKLPYTHVGLVAPDHLSYYYNHADIVISTSHVESFGMTLVEGQASGCLPVTFGNGGQHDIVDHLRTGYIARYPDVADMAEGLAWAVDHKYDRNSLHLSVERKFAAERIAKQYIELFKSLIER